MSAFLYTPEREGIRPFVFLHLPKAAGTSIRHGVLNGLPVKRKLTCKGTELWPWDRSFMVLRDPIDRFLSGWGERAASYGLDDLLSLLGNDSIPYNPPYKKWVWNFGSPTDIRHHLLPITHEINIGMVEKVESKGGWVKFTDLDEGIPAVMNWLGLLRPPLRVKRKGIKRRKISSLSKGEHQKIRNFFAEDYKFLGKFKGAYRLGS